MDAERVMVLGLGNMLYGDEGLGVHAAELLYRRWDFPPHVDVVDGGTQGHSLLNYVERAERLLILDAVDFDLEPGSVVVKESEEIPRYLTGRKISPHQNSFSEVLALAELRGTLPREVVLVGMQPQRLGLGQPLTSLTRQRLEGVLARALEVLRRWGINPSPANAGKALCHPGLRMSEEET